MAIKAAMTGHLVLATLHTTNALGAIPRLVDLGVPAYLLEETLLAVMSQRLVRRLCERCSVPLTPENEEYEMTARWLQNDIGSARASAGCGSCDGSGYSGRLAIAEVFLPDDETRPFIRLAGGGVAGPRVGLEGGPTTLEEAAIAQGFEELGVDAAKKVRRGATTMSEILRVHRLEGPDESDDDADGASPSEPHGESDQAEERAA